MPIEDIFVDEVFEPQFWLVTAMCVTYADISVHCGVFMSDALRSVTIPGLMISPCRQVGLKGFMEAVMKVSCQGKGDEAHQQQTGLDYTLLYVVTRAGTNTGLYWKNVDSLTYCRLYSLIPDFI